MERGRGGEGGERESQGVMRRGDDSPVLGIYSIREWGVG